MIPSEIKNFENYLRSILNGKSPFNQNIFDSQYMNYLKFLDILYKDWFPKNPKYKEKHIAEKLFIKEIKKSEMRDWVRIEFNALLVSSGRIYDRIIDFSHKGLSEELTHEILLFKEMLFEAAVFLDYGSLFIPGKKLGYNCGKRNVLHSNEIYDASNMLLRKMMDSRRLGQFVIPAISIFSIRQALELRLRYSLGVGDIVDNKGKLIKITGDKFIQVYEQLRKIDPNGLSFPMEFSILIKIFRWSQFYVHGGVAFYIWEIEWAQHLLLPLFSSGSHGNQVSAFGSIKISKDLYSRIPTILEELMHRPSKGFIKRMLRLIQGKTKKLPARITIERIEPESLII